jgi:hypothetical protein
MGSSAKNLPTLPIDSSSGSPVHSRDMGQADTLRYNVVTHVVEENYDLAIQDLRAFLVTDSEYPRFKERIEKYVYHAIDLINAIRAKRKFPGASSLTMAKQQELNERFREHFNELQDVLKKVEKIQVDLRIEDVRSTVWVVKALINAVFAVVLFAFFIEAGRGLFYNFWVVADDFLISITTDIFNYLKL